MSRRTHRVPFHLDAKGLQELPFTDQQAILRGADDLIGTGGRNLLVKILRGSRMKRLLELGLDDSPVHGHFRDLKDDEVLARVDWMILNRFLRIEYEGRLPVLVFTDRGWEIAREIRAEEFLRAFDAHLASGPPFDMSWLRERNRGLILLLLDKVEATGDARYVPVLEAWKAIAERKVRGRIDAVVRSLGGAAPSA
jgi:hypothetical protein